MVKNSRKLYKKDGKTMLKLSLPTLDGFCSYLLSENEHIKPSALVSLKNILNTVDESEYEADPLCKERLLFCRDVANTKIANQIKNKALILESVIGNAGNKYPGINPYSYIELTDKEVNYIESEIIPKYADNLYIFDHAIKMKDIVMNILTSDPANLDENIDAMKTEVTNTHKELLKHKVIEEDNELGVDDEIRRMKLLSCIREIKEPTHVLKTGITMLNDMLRGGFEQNREYCLFALPGEGKSTTLKEIAINILKYNKNYVCRDKTKRPCLLYFSMENRLQEDMQLFLQMAGHKIDIKDSRYSDNDIADIWDNSIFNDKEGIAFVYVYKSVYSVTTQYIRDKIDQLADKGYEVICVIQDYMKRIMPAIKEDEERLKLGVIANEFRAIAIDYQLAFITASQLNREGSKEIIPKRESGKYDEVMNAIDSYYIGESGLINENVDYSIFLVPFWESENKKQKWLGFKAVKRRYGGNTMSTRFYQPYEPDNPIKLQEDISRVTIGKYTLNENIHNTQFTTTGNVFISKDSVNAGSEKQQKSLSEMTFSGGFAEQLSSVNINKVDGMEEFDEESTPEDIRSTRLRIFLDSYGINLEDSDIEKYMTEYDT